LPPSEPHGRVGVRVWACERARKQVAVNGADQLAHFPVYITNHLYYSRRIPALVVGVGVR